MAKYDDAFSIQLNRTITAIEANTLALNGTLKSANDFKCSEKCDVPLVCANFSKTERQRIKEPHFRVSKLGSLHSSDCSRISVEIETFSVGNSTQKSQMTQKPNIIIRYGNEFGFIGEEPSERVNLNIDPFPKNKDITNYTKSGSTSVFDHVTNVTSIKTFMAYYMKVLLGKIEPDRFEPRLDSIVGYFNKTYLLTEVSRGYYFGLATAFYLYPLEDSPIIIEYIVPQFFVGLTKPVRPSFYLNAYYLEKNNNSLFKRINRLIEKEEQFLFVYQGSFSLQKNRYINPTTPPQFIENNIYVMDKNNVNMKYILPFVKPIHSSNE
ncbi:hypothetical protein G7062_10505 [Erysipelothrix sp. HDW6C]|uniref:hypothetical protein n=1 Tax=Erysipelothrix sp. HDW6C TaxID=2714930 RepID=UPI001408D240|nr:hypothetical protein [Erysipelothrix sp. HDW6C]QIK70707.1 hypothetical protein G7062_10505 [Erysipelothrix sp. HDW6C]